MFGLEGAEGGNPVWRQLLASHNRLVFLKFLNEMAGDYLGRTCLASNRAFLSELGDLFGELPADSEEHHCVLGIFQRMSLRSAVQRVIIDKAIIPRAFKILRDQGDTLSDFSLEYILALVINMSTNRKVRQMFEEDTGNQLVDILMTHWERCPADVRTYFNGALYSVLTSGKVRKRCVEAGLAERLQVGLEGQSEVCQRQVGHIVERLGEEPLDDTFMSYNETRDPENITVEGLEAFLKAEGGSGNRSGEVIRSHQLPEDDPRGQTQLAEAQKHFGAFWDHVPDQTTKFDITEGLGSRMANDSGISVPTSAGRMKPVTLMTAIDRMAPFTYSPSSEMADTSGNPFGTSRTQPIPPSPLTDRHPDTDAPVQDLSDNPSRQQETLELPEGFRSRHQLQRTPPSK